MSGFANGYSRYDCLCGKEEARVVQRIDDKVIWNEEAGFFHRLRVIHAEAVEQRISYKT